MSWKIGVVMFGLGLVAGWCGCAVNAVAWRSSMWWEGDD